jgi:transposase
MQLGPWQSRDDEKRKLVIKVKSLERALDTHRKTRRDLEKQLKKYEIELKEANEEINKLKKENEELRRQRDRYRDMTFKPNKKSSDKLKENGEELSSSLDNKTKRERGGQKGHKGVGRKTPPKVDRVQRVYLTHCPICSDPLNRSESIQTHTVEDIPPIEEYQKSVVRYETELQWCGNCQKFVKGRVEGVIPKSRLGLNVLLYVLIHKYFVRSTWEKIVDSLYQWYGIKVSKGGLVKMMHRAKHWLGDRYDQLLEEIRKSPVKHADETSWRVNGLNHWLWGFFTNKHAYYLIDESRGKGIPQKILNSPHPQDVLVRDDYGSYQKIPLKHQSCWAHLLRKSHEEANDPNASPEVKKLHNQLKRIFSSLNKIGI